MMLNIFFQGSFLLLSSITDHRINKTHVLLKITQY